MSRVGSYLWYLSASVRKRKPLEESVWGRLLDAIGAVLDQAYDTVLVSRRRRLLLNPDQSDTFGESYVDVEPADPNAPTAFESYYLSDDRAKDLDRYGRDRGLSRHPGEDNSAFAWRIATHPYRAGFLGTASGLRALIQESFGLVCDRIVEYYRDKRRWRVADDADTAGRLSSDRSRLVSDADLNDAITNGVRLTRIYSDHDLSLQFHFWVRISNPNGVTIDTDSLTEAIQRDQARPHTGGHRPRIGTTHGPLHTLLRRHANSRGPELPDGRL